MQIDKKTTRNVFIGVIICILLYWVLHETSRVKAIFAVIGNIISPFVFGASLAFILNVPMRAFERLLKGIKKDGLRRVVALLLTFSSVLLVLALVFLLLIPQLSETIQALVPKLYNFIIKSGQSAKEFLENHPQLMKWIDLDSFDWSAWAQKVASFLGNSVSTIVGGAFTVIGYIASALVDVVIAIVFAIYCLFQKETLARQGKKLLYAFIPEKVSDQVVRIARLANATFSNFLSGQCIEVCILGLMFAISMAIFRMPYIPLVSVLVAVTAFIPVVGAWVGCVLGAFFIFVANPILALWFIVMFVVLQQIENNLIYPRVVGTSIGLSGMWVLVAVGVGGDLMGVAGMFLMIPVTSVLYTLCSELTNSRLKKKEIAPEKLEAQPQEHKPKFTFKKKKKDTSKKTEVIDEKTDQLPKEESER